MNEISTLIKNYMERNNLSQTQFGRLIDAKQQSVSEWVRGEGTPSYKYCIAIMRLLEEEKEEK